MTTSEKIDAAFDEIITKAFTDLNEANLVVPVDRSIVGIFNDLRRRRFSLAARALMAVYWQICFSGSVNGVIPARLLSDWLWGPSTKPKHWRFEIKRALRLVTERTKAVYRTEVITLTLNGVNVEYSARPEFLGSLAPMVHNGRLRLLRTVKAPGKVTRDQLNRFRVNAEYSDAYQDRELRKIIANVGSEAQSQETLSNLGRQGEITMVFMPTMLGIPAVCKQLGRTARALAANATRRHKVEDALVPAFSGDRKIKCSFLEPDVTYAAFAANGVAGSGSRKGNSRAGRGYRLSRWLAFNGLKEGQEHKLLKIWATAAGPLQLTVVGVGPGNKFLGLEAMQAASLATLEKLNVRVYTPAGWQQRWTGVFGMTLEAETASGANSTSADLGDIGQIATLVLENGLRATARDLELDPGNLSRYINKGKGLTADQAASLRHYLFSSLPSGGVEIAGPFGQMMDEYHGNLGCALAYRRALCWSVVPLVPGSRTGYFKWKPYQTVLPSEEEIIRWWTQWPDASIGLVLGPLSRVFALDVDNEAAEKTLRNLLGDLPNCPAQLSGSYSSERPWKRHYLFSYPVDVRTGAKWEPLGMGLEFRGKNGLLVLAPSVHKDGSGRYAWEEGYGIWDMPLPTIPPQIRETLIEYTTRRSPAQQPANPVIAKVKLPNFGYEGRRFSERTQAFLGAQVQRGERNDRLFAAARELRDYGVPRDRAVLGLLKAAHKVGLGDDEARRTIDSAYSRASA